MIDKETGDVKFPGWERPLSRYLTREVFLNSSLAQGASVQVENGEYCSWRLSPTKWENDKWWITVVYFKGELLYQLMLAASEAEVSSGRESWSEEREMSMKSYYESVLEKLFGFSGVHPYKFHWGLIETVYDERSLGSYIIIKYAKK